MKISAVRAGNTTHIIMDGKHITSTDKELFGLIQTHMASPTPDTETAILEQLNPRLRMARKLNLDVKDGHLYLRGDGCPVPEDILPTLEEYVENGWNNTPIINFIKRLALNPSDHVRAHLFTFARKHGIQLNQDGFLILYKAVAMKDLSEHDYTGRVTQEYLRLRKLNLNPNDTLVVKKNDDVVFMHPGTWEPEDAKGEDALGTVLGIFQNIDAHIPKKRTIYTDKHTKTMEIGLRQLVRMPREKVDPNTNNSCSYGLHVGTHSYVKKFGAAHDPVFACLVCPSWIVAFPNDDDSKMRTEAYYTYALMDRSDDAAWTEIEGSYFETDLRGIEAEDMAIKQKQLDEIDLSSLSGAELDRIISAKSVVKQRLVALTNVTPDSSVNSAPVNAPHSFDTNDPTGKTKIAEKPVVAKVKHTLATPDAFDGIGVPSWLDLNLVGVILQDEVDALEKEGDDWQGKTISHADARGRWLKFLEINANEYISFDDFVEVLSEIYFIYTK